MISPGSRSPGRVPITRPSSGVNPMEVSIGRPPAIAEADAPFPRCRTIWLISSWRRPRTSATRWETNSWLVPWKPYRRRFHSRAVSRSMAYVCAAAGSVWKKPVSNTATCGSPGSSSRATRMPRRLAGLCSGASSSSFSMSASTSAVTSTGSWKAGPPWTTRWPIASTPKSVGCTRSSSASSSTRASAAVWSGNPASAVRSAAGDPVSSPRRTVMVPTGSPIRSTRAQASSASSAVSRICSLREDEPELMTSTRVMNRFPGSRRRPAPGRP